MKYKIFFFFSNFLHILTTYTTYTPEQEPLHMNNLSLAQRASPLLCSSSKDTKSERIQPWNQTEISNFDHIAGIAGDICFLIITDFRYATIARYIVTL